MTEAQERAMWEHRPTWELKNMVKALSMMPWLNTPADNQRKAIAQAIIAQRRRK